MGRPVVFIGSSSEGEPIANAIKENLDGDCDVHVWTQGVFELGNSYLESLTDELDKVDFAVLVLTNDDVTISREQQEDSPRDNVLFELGLFMGKLGRNRSFFVYDGNKNIKIPSDLLGIKGAEFTLQTSGTLTVSLQAACNKIHAAIRDSGMRPRLDKMQVDVYTERLDFCNKITGCWWERIKPDTAAALSFVSIQYDEETFMLKINGRSFDKQGDYIAYWESKSTGIHFKEQQVIYQWKGWFPSKPSEPFEGVGEISFYGLTDIFTEGNGIFSNINVADISSIQKSSFELARSNEKEDAIIYSKDKEKIARLIKDKISKMF